MAHPLDSLAFKDFYDRAGDQLFKHLLPFWCGPALDREQGGWMAWLSNDLQPDHSQPRGLIVNARILWAFSAAFQTSPGPLYREMADRAFDVVMNRFWDREHGGAYWRLDRGGRVLDDSKKTYGQAFYIYALTEYYRAFQSLPALGRAITVFEFVEHNAFDLLHGGYWEVRQRDWSEAGAEARLSEKDMNEKKSMNNHLHVLEAYTNLYRVWKHPRIEKQLRELILIFQKQILDIRTQHLHHFFDEAWNVRSDSYTFGHDIEASWLMCEAAEALGNPDLEKRVRASALGMAEAVLTEALDADGAVCYEGRGGQVMDSGKECWPQAEAVVGFINAFQLSGEERYLDAARRVWDFIEKRLVDRVHGEWFWRITPEGTVDSSLPKVSEWKGPYHATRMCLETMRRLKLISSQV